ncbi:hypothetical protein S40293_10676 [Stachybotrys chartarum IBT 40293]|nr:hypothetical protein S40293_10676 [Stachybotrys chartarum IBT 40293]
MARGNQRDKAREAAQKKQAAMVRSTLIPPTLTINSGYTPHHPRCKQAGPAVGHVMANFLDALPVAQKKGNTMSGSEMQRAKETAAEIMRQKQAAGTVPDHALR